MIRDFITSPNISQLNDVIDRFKIEPSSDNLDLYIVILGFKILTPDSFIWRILINDAIYYLYAEDYVQNINEVMTEIQNHAKAGTNLEFVEARVSGKFESSEPVKASARYTTPENVNEFMKYAVDSGYDFVFLVKTNEDSDDAYFD